MSPNVEERRRLVRALVDRTAAPESVLPELRRFGWDSEPLVELTPRHVRSMLEDYLAGRATAADVAKWADALEVRDDVDASQAVIEALFQLANPEINGDLTPENAKSLITALSQPGGR